MGLDISAYENVVLVDGPAQDDPDPYETGWKNGWQHTFHQNGFERSERGIVPNGWYDYKGGESFEFRAGSYSGYNFFREQLCKAALEVEPQEVWDHPDDFVDAPFFELINFSDCEGVIGPEAAADLAEDFDNWAEKVLPQLEDWQSEYMAWREAFHLAAKTGMVIFH